MCAQQIIKCLIVKCLIIILLTIGLVSGCSLKEEESADLFVKYYKLPDKIIIYNHGNKEEIDKKDQLYHQIIQLLNQMFADVQHIDMTQTAIDEYNEKQAKEVLALEFIYSDTYEFHYKDWRSEINGEYCRLFIPLDRPSNATLIFFGDNEKYFSGPVGMFVEPTKLIELINPSK